MLPSRWIWVYIFPMLMGVCFGQNFIPDGGFEEAVEICEKPDLAFRFSRSWYALDATPDLFVEGCRYDDDDNFFWKSTIKAYSGRSHAGLSGRWNSNATYVSEGLAIRLSESLVAGTTYYFSMAVKNQGGYQGLADLTTCQLRPKKHIDIFTSQDSIYLINDHGNGTAESSGSMVASLASNAITSIQPGEWTLVTTCFVAQGGEQYLAIQMPLGTFGELPPCAATASSGVFRSFYYYIDDVSLTSFPRTLEDTIWKCQEEPLMVDLDKVVGGNLPVEPVYYWEDGFAGAVRTLEQEGRYFIEAQLDCGSVPLQLQVSERKCTPDLYVPNAFSPNGDGINDDFKPEFGPGMNLSDYRLQIFDRWGNKVFETVSQEVAWNGANVHNKGADGIYIWVLQYLLKNEDEETSYESTGSIQLLR